MKKLLLVIILSIYVISCKMLVGKYYGLEKPKPRSDKEIIEYLNRNKVGYDYLFRPRDVNNFRKVSNSLGGANLITLIDQNMNILAIEDSTVCHMGVRNTACNMIKNPSMQKIRQNENNIEPVFDNFTTLIHQQNGHTWNGKPSKRLAVILSINMFSGLNAKMSDADFIIELQNKGLRDSVDIIVINFDLPKNE